MTFSLVQPPFVSSIGTTSSGLASPGLVCWPPVVLSKSGQALSAFVRYQLPKSTRRCLDLLWSWDMRHGAWLESGYVVGVMAKNGGSPSHRRSIPKLLFMTTGLIWGWSTILGTHHMFTRENIRKLWKIIMVNWFFWMCYGKHIMFHWENPGAITLWKTDIPHQEIEAFSWGKIM